MSIPFCKHVSSDFRKREGGLKVFFGEFSKLKHLFRCRKTVFTVLYRRFCVLALDVVSALNSIFIKLLVFRFYSDSFVEELN